MNSTAKRGTGFEQEHAEATERGGDVKGMCVSGIGSEFNHKRSQRSQIKVQKREAVRGMGTFLTGLPGWGRDSTSENPKTEWQGNGWEKWSEIRSS